MNFNDHSKLEGHHAFLSASKYHWVNYDEDKLVATFLNYLAAQRGTRLHAFAKECIELKQKLPRSQQSLNAYVNDAIGYRMNPEQVLYYSPNCFGTADTISFRNRMLRIHDYKSGAVPAHMEQLMIYAALFCLEYGKKPTEFDTELRLYQSDEIVADNPEPGEISAYMDKIVDSDRIITKLKLETI